MSERIKQWWARNNEALAISKAEWDELDAAIREDERARLLTSTREPSAGMISLWRDDAEKLRRWLGSARSTYDRTTLTVVEAVGELSAEVERLRASAAISAAESPKLRLPLGGWDVVADHTLPPALVILKQSGIELARFQLAHGVRIATSPADGGGL